ncbi:hypothetical protein J6590_061763 [Homalodisca vitripennis]|nr:hypothetical protein J6590_061763 [Homalodisca vitripennis]
MELNTNLKNITKTTEDVGTQTCNIEPTTSNTYLLVEIEQMKIRLGKVENTIGALQKPQATAILIQIPDHKHATSTATRHPYRPASNKSLTFAPKRARPSIICISSGREFQRRHA